MGNPRHVVGLEGEERAAKWLRSRGWTVLERRWRCPAGEIDIVCLDPARRLVGVEVRVRRSGRAGSGLESFTVRHRSRVRAALVAYVTTHRVPHDGLRLDLIAISRDRTGWRLVRHPAIDAW